MKTRSYAILAERRLIRVRHFDLHKSYWNRARSLDEAHANEIARLLMRVTGLQRLNTRHNIRYGYVEFKIKQALFAQAACALRLTYKPDGFQEDRLMGYPD